MPKKPPPDLREAFAAFGAAFLGAAKDTAMRALETAADVVLEDVQSRIEDAGNRVKEVRRSPVRDVIDEDVPVRRRRVGRKS